MGAILSSEKCDSFKTMVGKEMKKLDCKKGQTMLITKKGPFCYNYTEEQEDMLKYARRMGEMIEKCKNSSQNPHPSLLIGPRGMKCDPYGDIRNITLIKNLAKGIDDNRNCPGSLFIGTDRVYCTSIRNPPIIETYENMNTEWSNKQSNIIYVIILIIMFLMIYLNRKQLKKLMKRIYK